MGQFSAITASADKIISNPTWDIVSIFALIAIGFFYGISAGKRRIASTLVQTYLAFVITQAAPLEQWFADGTSLDRFFIRAGAFAALFLLLSFFLGPKRGRGFAPASSWWSIFLLSFLQAGLLIHLIVGFLPKDKIKLLAPLTQNLFANPDLHIWWLVVPVAALAILKRLERRDD